MARLTRMQKYAERRKEMASENEATQTTPALDTYKNKLDALEANFNELKKEEKLEELNIEPIDIEKPKQEVITPTFEEVTKEFNPNEEKDEFDFLSSLDTDNIDKAINDLINQKISILDDEPKIEEVEADKKVTDSVKEALDETKEFNPEETLNKIEEVVYTKPEESEVLEVSEEPKEEPVKEEKPQEEAPIETKEEVFKPQEDINVIDQDYKDIANTLANEVKELDGEVEPVKEEEKVLPVNEVKVEPVTEEKTETPIEEVKEEPVVVNAPVKEPEVINVIDQDYETIAHSLANIVEELDGKVEPVKEEEKVLPVNEVKVEPVTEEKTETPIEEVKEEEPVEEIPSVEEVEETVETPVVDDNDEILEPIEEVPEISVDDILGDIPETETEEKSSNYVDETLKEVEEYNKQDGRKTADDVKDMIVDDIRHNKPEEMDNEEFANTVSLQIDKVLSEINADIPSIDVSDVTLDNVVKPVDIDMEDAADKLADTIEHPVLTQAVSKESAPVEIKSMEETLTSDVVDDTIPFMMEDVKEDKEIEYEEMDDEKPNKILNAILIVLIVILVIILGVITYYLLYAKGIIG